jgi:hypothetical protein
MELRNGKVTIDPSSLFGEKVLFPEHYSRRFRQLVERLFRVRTRQKCSCQDKVSDMPNLSRSQRLERRNFKKEFVQIFSDFVIYVNSLRNPDRFFIQMADRFLELL